MMISIHGLADQKPAPLSITLLQTINIDFEDFTIAPIQGWNVWVQGQAHPLLLNSIGGTTAFQLIDVNGIYYADDEAYPNLNDIDFPNAVLNRLMYLDAANVKTFDLTGLNPNNRYDFILGCYILGTDTLTESQTSFWVEDVPVQIPLAKGSVLYKGVFNKIQPDANGIIKLKISGTRPNDFGGFNGMVVKEYS